jgi:hypothetical protein
LLSFAEQIVKVKHEYITKHPILTGKATVHIQMEHYEGLHPKEKGQRIKGVQGLATNDFFILLPPFRK